MKKKHLFNIFILFFITFLCVFFLEILMQFHIIDISKIGSSMSETRWEEIWLKDKTSFTYENTKYDPLLGWTMQENIVDGNMSGTIINTNSIGIRNKKEYPLNKTKTRIITIGDSYTFGQCVNDKETFSYYLEESSDAEVLNFGVPGYGIDQMYLRLLTKALKYNPDYVIIGFVLDDILRTGLDFRSYSKPKFNIENSVLKITNSPIISPEKFKSNLKIINLYKILQETNQEETKIIESMQLSYTLLQQIIQETKQANATPIIILLPEAYTELSENQIPVYDEICKTTTCINPSNIILNSNITKFDFSCHYSANLHKIIANTIKEHINSTSPTKYQAFLS